MEHVSRLKMIFHCLAQANLKLKCTKRHILRGKVAYLSHVVSTKGVSTDPEKVKTVVEWPEPRLSSDVRSFLGA